VLADFEDKTSLETAAETSVASFTVWGEASTEALGALGAQVDARHEAPSLRFDAVTSSTSQLQLRSSTNFEEELVRWAKVKAWSPEEENFGDEDRVMYGRFEWQPTSQEVLSFYESAGSEMAFEFDLKQINRSNEDVLPEVEEIDPGICLPWEKNDFWIGTREYSHLIHNFPDEAGFYWDTGISDSCQYKDLTFGLFHPDELSPSEIYDATIFFDGGGAVESFPFPWEVLWDGVWPAIDNESAVGDADSSQIEWGLSLLGTHCDFSPTACVGIPGVDVEGVGDLLLEEGYDSWGGDPFEEYGPAAFPGCYQYNNPLYVSPQEDFLGVVPCTGAT
jgi:hypothetical protein